MNLHEYQAKQILRNNGIDVLPGYIAYTPDEAVSKVHLLHSPKWVVKAQIHAGGRAKAGGIQFVSSKQELRDVVESLIGSKLETPQTPRGGVLVRKVYIEEACAIKEEFYLSLTVDRMRAKIRLMISPKGGINITETSLSSPETMQTIYIDPLIGLWPHHIRQISYGFHLSYNMIQPLQQALIQIYSSFVACDAELIEINPLVLTTDAKLFPLDAKISIDDNALYRRPDLLKLKDVEDISEIESESEQLGFSYCKLDGNVGCMVNGAGLALSTMDLLKQNSINAANFLDIGGGATQERITSAFRLILSDPQIDCVLINIFGGITRCDILAKGIVHVINDIRISVPLVVRIQGTNVEEGRRIFQESNIDIITANTLEEAVNHVKAIVGKT
ncbi:MAG: ADP-forming succinate--CoA ligase subunit beta [Alphaproteobacteria bacterium]|nr:MAG: ADP-forming succinate--CoA ligase subunit beta [Alphaproteobacteria bacterium]